MGRIAPRPVGVGMNMDDHSLAASLASEAGERLLARRAQGSRSTLKEDGDALSHNFLVESVRAARPTDAVLSEEGIDSRERLTRDRVWIIDPLDGTREYGEPPRSDWAVHVALWASGHLVAGAVALPAEDLLFSSADPACPAPDEQGLPVLAVSRTRPPNWLDALLHLLPATSKPMGSAGYKAMAVVRGEVDAYVHGGGINEWDLAAPVAVAAAQGIACLGLDGQPLSFNQEKVRISGMIMARPELASEILRELPKAIDLVERPRMSGDG